jgi:hypothetical protein
MIGERTVDGFPALTLGSAAAGGIEAAFVPSAGMVGCSLRHRGDELLGRRGGLEAYVAQRKTMGIPLLHPWANRLSRRRFSVAGRDVAIDPDATPLRLDANGLPMHGLLSAAGGWRVERHEAAADGAVLAARFDFAAHDDLMAAFPFAHELRFEATLHGATLTIERARIEPGRLGVRAFDDAYAAPPAGDALASVPQRPPAPCGWWPARADDAQASRSPIRRPLATACALDDASSLRYTACACVLTVFFDTCRARAMSHIERCVGR